MSRRRAPVASAGPLAGRDAAFFRELVELAPDAKVIVDEAGTIVLVNAQAERLFGYDRDRLLGRPIEVLLPPRLHTAHERHRRSYAAESATRPMGAGIELFGVRQDGVEFPVDISLSPVRNGDELLVVSSIRDVSERRRHEREIRRLAAEAERANAAKDEFLSHMSHELRTPLNAILGFAQLLDLDATDQETRDSLGHIVQAGRHLLQLINEILDLAQIESGRIDVVLEPVSLSRVVDEAVDIVRPLAAVHPVELVVAGGGPLEVLADPRRLLQIVLNLLGNAVKFNYPGGRVAISWSERDGRVRLEVADTGVGIEQDDLTRVFERFHRTADVATEGTGLGLPLAKRLVEAMGGEIGVVSTAGLGSTFSVELRVAPSQPAVAQPPAGCS